MEYRFRSYSIRSLRKFFFFHFLGRFWSVEIDLRLFPQAVRLFGLFVSEVGFVFNWRILWFGTFLSLVRCSAQLGRTGPFFFLWNFSQQQDRDLVCDGVVYRITQNCDRIFFAGLCILHNWGGTDWWEPSCCGVPYFAKNWGRFDWLNRWIFSPYTRWLPGFCDEYSRCYRRIVRDAFTRRYNVSSVFLLLLSKEGTEITLDYDYIMKKVGGHHCNP